MSSKSNVSFLELGPSLLLKICRLVFVLLPCPEYLFCNNVCKIKDGIIYKESPTDKYTISKSSCKNKAEDKLANTCQHVNWRNTIG